jgi:uncharacterized protein (DUF885 family)
VSPAADVRGLADELDALRWSIYPFWATYMGVPGHDAEVHDVTAEADARHRAAVADLNGRAQALAAQADRGGRDALDHGSAVTLTTVEHTARSLLAEFDAGLVEFVVSPMSDGPGMLFHLASVTTPANPSAAQDHLTRCRRLDRYLDGCAERLRAGAAGGRTPVRALVERTLGMVDGYLESDPAEDPLVGVPAPAGWDGEQAWRRDLTDAVRDVVRPAVSRYRDLLGDLLAAARDDDRPGLVHLPGGAEAYDQLVLVHTSLSLTAQEVHEAGLAAVAELREQMATIGARLGLVGFEAVRAAAATSSEGVQPDAALAAARAAVTRAEAALPGWFAEPLPPSCRVEPMSPHLGKAGTPPHYSPPTPDGRRPGTYWFNLDEVGAGAGWDLEATAYHEAVPGHHLQMERMLSRTELPAIQRLGEATAHGEGWGLYAEYLAEEMGLYGDDSALAGALAARIFRACRLVVDTGMHALGWSRSRALEFMTENAPLPTAEIASEIDRYIAWPGQALAYYVGFGEILRLRESARDRLGGRFSLPGFHAAVLDSGGIPLPAVARAVDAWVAATRS